MESKNRRTEPDCVERAGSPNLLNRPVFVGGTGRSGTTVTSRVVGASHSVQRIPVEVRFHVDPGGLTDFVESQVSLDRFLSRMRNHWYRRTTLRGENRGFHSVVDDDVFGAAMDSFRDDGDADPIRAARHLMSSLFDPSTLENAASRWVEMTPPNVLKVSGLREIYPDAQFVHVYRDGRDVAHSVGPLHWGPNDAESAMLWWEKILVEGLREMRGHEDAVLLVSMEDLTVRRREVSLDRLYGFLGLSVDEGVQNYFERYTLPDRAHVGRWDQGMSRQDRREINMRYDAAVERISREFPSLDLAL